MLAIHPQHTGLQWATTILYLPFILNTLDYREPQQYYTYRTPSTHWTTVSHNNIILTAHPQHTGLQWATTILNLSHTLNILDYSEPQQYYTCHSPSTHWTKVSHSNIMLAPHPQYTGLQWATIILYLPHTLNTLDYSEPQQYYTYCTPSIHWTTVSQNNMLLATHPQHTRLSKIIITLAPNTHKTLSQQNYSWHTPWTHQIRLSHNIITLP